MKQLKVRFFLDYKKEERWINNLALEGKALVKCKPLLYWFEKTNPGEYIYLIELFQNMPEEKLGTRYINFLNEFRIECVDSIYGWGYLRKKSCDGEFELLSDLSSKLSYAKRLSKNYFIGMLYALFLAYGTFQLFYSNIVLGKILFGLLILLCGNLAIKWFRNVKKSNRIKKEMISTE